MTVYYNNSEKQPWKMEKVPLLSVVQSFTYKGAF